MVVAYALAQGMLQYCYPAIDFGLRHIGARLIAVQPLAGSRIVEKVQKQRGLMALVVLPLLVLYALSVKATAELPIFLIGLSAAGCLYAASLDWVAWGKERFRLYGLGRALPSLSILACALLWWNSRAIVWWLLAGNVVGNTLQALIFLIWWKEEKPLEDKATHPLEIRDALAFRRTSIFGLVWLSNIAFNSIDSTMLGSMSNIREVGLYAVAYWLVN